MKSPTLAQSLKIHTNAFLSVALPNLEIILTGLLIQYPGLQLAVYEAIGLYGFYMAIKQEEVNMFVEDLMKHPEIYREEIVSSKEFRDGFVLSFENYLRARTENKRVYIQNVLMGFAKSTNKKDFQIERLQDTILKISTEGIDLLLFIKQEVLPIIEENVNIEMVKYNSTIPEESERLLAISRQKQKVSEIIMKWIYDRYNSNSPSVKKQYGLGSEHNPELSAKIALIEHKVTEEKTACWPELLGLGIFRMSVSGGLIGGGAGANYALTQFGYDFIEFITTD
jgi:hypothetical protein